VPSPVTDQIANHIREILCLIGEDVNRDGLEKTPTRVAEALEFLTRGYHLNGKDVVNDALFTHSGNELIATYDIEFSSLCEHHMLPILGVAHICYIPHGHVIGLSKLARIVDMFSARLQIQERLTRQIAEEVSRATGSDDVAVVTDASHTCMIIRGVQKQRAHTKVGSFLGCFENPDMRSDFWDMINNTGR